MILKSQPQCSGSLQNKMQKKRKNAVNREVIRQEDIDNVGSWKKIIENVLSFKVKIKKVKSKLMPISEFMPIFKEAFEVWRAIPYERAKNERSEAILAAYLRQGKIRDYLTKISTFIDQIDSMEDASIVRLKAYNNYFYFLQRFIWDLQEKLKHINVDSVPELQEQNIDTVAWFIHTECTSVSTIRDIPKVYDAVKRLKDSLEVGKPMTKQQKEDVGIISGWFDLFKVASKDENIMDEDIIEMQRIRDSLEECISLMRDNADNANTLLNALTECFTDEWFDMMDPESETSIVNNSSKDELKALYSKKLNDFFSKLEKKKLKF